MAKVRNNLPPGVQGDSSIEPLAIEPWAAPTRKALNGLLKTEEAKDPMKRSLKSLMMGALRLLNVVQNQPATSQAGHY